MITAKCTKEVRYYDTDFVAFSEGNTYRCHFGPDVVWLYDNGSTEWRVLDAECGSNWFFDHFEFLEV